MIKITLSDTEDKRHIQSLFFDEMPTKDQFMIAAVRDQIDELYINMFLDALEKKNLPDPVGKWEIANPFYVSDFYCLYVQKEYVHLVKDCI